jgi:hypothetical protein
MPTNLPDPRKPPRKTEETILNGLVVWIVVAMAIACAILIWSKWADF